MINRIAQDPNYHNFADKRVLLGINNFADVASNFPFILIGILGIILILRLQENRDKFVNRQEVLPFLVAFFGIFLVGFGSGYYHLNPNNHTLVWDRIAIAIGFMAIFSIIISERINLRAGLFLLFPLLICGIGSVVYWNYTENLGVGDLRPYLIVQFFPLLAISLIMFLFPAKYSGSKYLVGVVFWYLLAKIFEYFDWQIFELSGSIVSGHTLKHFASAIAAYCLMRYVKFRMRVV